MLRIGLILSALLVAANATAAGARETFHLRSLSTRYDFRWTLEGGCPSDASETAPCVRTAELVVADQRGGADQQRIRLENVSTVMPPDDREDTIVVGDFNFDGREDFAVQVTDNGGPYGGPTFAVFLDSGARPRFVQSEALSRLTEETLGLFRVDAKRRRLVTTAKSGCCYHVTEEYVVVRDAPVAVFRLIEDATHDGYVLETRETLEKGKWRRQTRRLPQERD